MAASVVRFHLSYAKPYVFARARVTAPSATPTCFWFFSMFLRRCASSPWNIADHLDCGTRLIGAGSATPPMYTYEST